MKEREIKLKTVIVWCLFCGWSVTDFHFLFSRIFNVMHYRRLWTDADTPKGMALAAQSRDDAIKDLHEFMKARCFPDEIRQAVIWLYNH